MPLETGKEYFTKDGVFKYKITHKMSSPPWPSKFAYSGYDTDTFRQCWFDEHGNSWQNADNNLEIPPDMIH